MLTRLYINNYKCLVNFDWPVRSVDLLMGLNGTGKSTILDVLMAIRDFVTRDGNSQNLFRGDYLTRWQMVSEQSFELEVAGNEGHYQYKLVIEHNRDRQENRVITEHLTYEGQPLYESNLGQVQLYRDNHSQGPTFQFDWKKSGLGALGARQDNQKLTWFRNWLGRIQILRIDPFAIASESRGEDADLHPDAGNFAAWYHHLVLDMPELTYGLATELRDLWTGFTGLRLRQVSKSVRELEAVFEPEGNDGQGVSYACGFNELSDGQRTLIVLCTLLHYARATANTLVCIDEPMNFVALPEIQPWLVNAVNLAEDSSFQLLLASHHPEVINYLAPDRATCLVRDTWATRVRDFVPRPGSQLTAAEIFARGWEDG